MQKRILVTGGCGFIGSHTLLHLIESGFEVVSIDNFSNAHREVLTALKELTGKEIHNLELDLTDREATFRGVKKAGPFEAIIHFAAYKSIGESMAFPFKYYQNNIPSVLNISEAAIQNDIRHFIFSSSCSVYGNAEKIPVTEKTPMGEATSPYGLTKQIGEQQLIDVAKRFPEFKLTLLRYFNPAGAHPSAKIGEASRKPPTNLVPIICEVAAGKREEIMVYGDDYPTRDGSCIRDYIHVMDLAEAHTAALEYSLSNRSRQKVEAFNLGIGEGVSVLEAIEAFEKVTSKKVNFRIGDRRPGDVSAIYARYDKAQRELNWSPRRNIEDIMASAWEWEKNRWGSDR